MFPNISFFFPSKYSFSFFPNATNSCWCLWCVWFRLLNSIVFLDVAFFVITISPEAWSYDYFRSNFPGFLVLFFFHFCKRKKIKIFFHLFVKKRNDCSYNQIFWKMSQNSYCSNIGFKEYFVRSRNSQNRDSLEVSTYLHLNYWKNCLKILIDKIVS